MTIARIMLPLVCSVPVLLGCTTPAVAPTAEITVQPLLRIRDSAGSARDFYQLGRFYQGQNRFAQAAAAYRRALESHKDDIEARNALATTYSAQGKLNEAIAEFEAILKVTPHLAHLHNNLGYAYYLQNNFGKAIATFETAIALEPRNQRAYNNLGLVYRKLGEAEKSRLAFARAADLSGSSAIAPVAVADASMPATDGNIASIAPSIALKNDTASVDLQPLQPPSPPTPLPLAGEGSEGSRIATFALPIVSPPIPLLAPSSLAQKVIGSIALSTKGVLAETNGAFSAPAFATATATAAPQIADSVVGGGTIFRLEIANGNGVTGLARRVRATLVQQGLPTSRLINLKPYRTLETTIQYRSGFRDAALRLSRNMPKPPALISNDRLRASADVQLVLGKDAASTVALFGTDIDAVKLAKEVVERDDAS